MKWLLLLIYCIVSHVTFSQTLQLHYDARHTLDPKHTKRNFVSLYFEYFKMQDSGHSYMKPGSFLLKTQADFWGKNNNMGQLYLQASQTVRFWQPKVFINLQYNGGLGITEPKEYSYYITNTYSAGISYPFRWKNTYLSSVLNYKYLPYHKKSHDFLYTMYWYNGLWNYKAELAGDFSIWTENKNHGDDYTKDLHGKRFYFFAEPQFWYKINSAFSAGTKVNMNYHVLTTNSVFQIYPTIALKWKL